jgi:hypothetical protein
MKTHASSSAAHAAAHEAVARAKAAAAELGVELLVVAAAPFGDAGKVRAHDSVATRVAMGGTAGVLGQRSGSELAQYLANACVWLQLDQLRTMHGAEVDAILDAFDPEVIP